MKKKLLTLILAIATCGMMASAATKYEINVAGVEVTSDNSSRITGGDITGGYAVYDASSNTLTCYNLKIYRTGQDNYGIHNRKCDNLKIVFSGTCSVTCADNALKLERGTTLEALSGSNTTLYSSARIVVNLKSYKYYFTGSGFIDIQSAQSGYEAIKGDGLTSTEVYFQGARVAASSANRSAVSSFSASVSSGGVTIYGNGSNASVNDVRFVLLERAAILEPYEAKIQSNSIYNASGAQIKSETIYISDDYVAIINSNYFANDANLKNAMLALYPKGYITGTDVANRTSLDLSHKNLTSIAGVQWFTELTSLDCSSNNITSFNISTLNKLQKFNCSYNQVATIYGSLPASLTEFYCNSNNLTSLPALPSGLKKLSCFSNKLTSLNVTGRSSLTEIDCHDNQLLTSLICHHNALVWLDARYCPAMTELKCNNNNLSAVLNLNGCSSLTTVDCSGNRLSIIELEGCKKLRTLYCQNNLIYTFNNMDVCTALTELNCGNNLLTALPTLPNSLQSLDCSSNKFSGKLTVGGYSALTTLNVSNNTGLTYFECWGNALTSLNVQGCTALETLDCANNALTSLPSLPSNLKRLNCSANRLTSLSSLPSGLITLVCAANQINSLSVKGLNSLEVLTIYANQIKESAMGQLVDDLRTIPAGKTGDFLVHGGSGEGNEITPAQVLKARGKRWLPQQYKNDTWSEILVGDVNGDGKVNVSDVTTLVNMILKVIPPIMELGDINGDGSVNVSDVTALVNIILNIK